MQRQLFLYLLLFFFFNAEAKSRESRYEPIFERIDPKDVTIYRDQWGVPHVFGTTDAAAAYGLAWANAEDNFDVLLEVLTYTTGFAGRAGGKDAAPYDFYTHAIKAQERSAAFVANEASEAYLKYLDGYCQGVNAYVYAHWDRIKTKKAFPVTPEKLVQGYFVSFSALCGVADYVGDAVDGKWDKQFEAFKESKEQGVGSNAFAIGPGRTKDGHTYLCVNPHFAVDGPFTFYEAHLHSEEGLNCAGATFQGGNAVALGSNMNLGWAHTWNYFDRIDNYKLEMNPKKKKKEYKFDGKWVKIEKRPIWIKVKLGFMKIAVRKKTYYTVYGPAFKSKGGIFYALRAPSLERIGAGEQMYRMNKATSWEEFRAVLDMQRLPMFNLVYGDKDGHIYYLHNGLVAKRSDKLDWKKIITSTAADTRYTEYYKVDELQQVLDPACGYVFNTNNTPLNASCASANEKRTFPDWLDERPGNNNRAERFMELIDDREQHSFADFQALKYDQTYPQNSHFLNTIKPLLELKPSDHPEVAEVLQRLKDWNWEANANSVGATVGMLTLAKIFKLKGYGDRQFITGVGSEVDEAMYVKALSYTRDYLLNHFQRLDVPLIEMQQFYRQGTKIGVHGFPDALMAVYTKENAKDGNYKVQYGDTYIQFADFGKNGLERLQTLLPFQNTATVFDYEDQIPIYNDKGTKPLYMDRETIEKHAVRQYHPN